MEIKPSSFFLGLGAALVLPLLAKVLRPLAVEAMAAGMGVMDEARRVIAEQMEVIEDIAAEAKAKREASMTAAALTGAEEAAEHGEEAAHGEETAEASGESRPRPRPQSRRPAS
jgi:hypothetical protein